MIIWHARSYLNRVEKLGGKRRTEKVNYNNGSDTQIIYYRNETPNVSSQTDSLYFRTMILKPMQLMGWCIKTKPKNQIYTL